MLTVEEYYKAPAQEVFDDIKANAIKIWETYDDTHGYRSEKINKIKDIENVSDNAWFIVAMFDWSNQGKLLKMVKAHTAEKIIEARGY